MFLDSLKVSMFPAVTFIVGSLMSGVIVFIGAVMLVFNAMMASKKLFTAMLCRIMKATPRFFDITPLGRIVSRYEIVVCSKHELQALF